MLPAQPNKSLIDGLACLQAIASSSTPIGVRELARFLGLETTRVNRLLMTLAHLGMVQQTSNRKYISGPGIHVLSAQSLYGSGLLRRSLPHLDRIMEECECAVALGVLWRREVAYLYHNNPARTRFSPIGGHDLYPAEQSVIGQLLLAYLPPETVADLYRDTTISGFPKGIPSFQRHLAAIRKKGYNRIDHPQKTGKFSSVAVTVGSPPYAALACANYPHLDIESRLLPKLQKIAAEIQF